VTLQRVVLQQAQLGEAALQRPQKTLAPVQKLLA
jgi:uncharacterized protein YjbI with pentapeptide repeats